MFTFQKEVKNPTILPWFDDSDILHEMQIQKIKIVTTEMIRLCRKNLKFPASTNKMNMAIIRQVLVPPGASTKAAQAVPLTGRIKEDNMYNEVPVGYVELSENLRNVFLRLQRQ